jgi:hypothetical protein
VTEGKRQEAEEGLRRHRNLEECLLEDVRWRRYGSEIHLVFNSVWDESGELRARILEEPRHVEIRGLGVHELELVNNLSRGMVENPEQLNWGLAEVAVVRLEDARVGDQDAVQAVVQWDSERSLRILAADVRLLELPSDEPA